jgi:hypothetical protein
VLGDIKYRIYDFFNGQWNLAMNVDGLDNYCGYYNVSYTPGRDKIKIETLLGFYIEVYAEETQAPPTPTPTPPPTSNASSSIHRAEQDICSSWTAVRR